MRVQRVQLFFQPPGFFQDFRFAESEISALRVPDVCDEPDVFGRLFRCFFANFRFAGILILPRVIYHFLFLIRFTGFFVAFPGGRPLLRLGCTISGALRAILAGLCSISGVFRAIPAVLCSISADFCSIGWLHQKNVPVPVL